MLSHLKNIGGRDCNGSVLIEYFMKYVAQQWIRWLRLLARVCRYWKWMREQNVTWWFNRESCLGDQMKITKTNKKSSKRYTVYMYIIHINFVCSPKMFGSLSHTFVGPKGKKFLDLIHAWRALGKTVAKSHRFPSPINACCLRFSYMYFLFVFLSRNPDQTLSLIEKIW